MAPATRAALRTRSVNLPPPPAVCTRKRVSAQKRPRPNADPPRRSERVRLRESLPHPHSVPSLTPTFEKPLQHVQRPKRKSILTNDFKHSHSQGPAPKRTRRAKPESKVPLIPGLPPAPTAEKELFLRLMMEPPPVSPSDVLHNQSTVTSEIREILVDWMMEVANEYNARPHTLAAAVSYLDRILVKVSLARKNLQLLAAVCVMLACKLEEADPPTISDIIFLCDHVYNREDVLAMEKMVITHLNFDMSQPTYVSMVSKIAKEVASDANDCDSSPNHTASKHSHLGPSSGSPCPLEAAMVEAAEFAARVALHDKAACHYPPCVVAAGCVAAACHVNKVESERVFTVMEEDDMWHKVHLDVRAAEARVFQVMKTLLKRHEVDKSRFVLLKWPHMARAFQHAAVEFRPYIESDTISSRDSTELTSQNTPLSRFGSSISSTLPR